MMRSYICFAGCSLAQTSSAAAKRNKLMAHPLSTFVRVLLVWRCWLDLGTSFRAYREIFLGRFLHESVQFLHITEIETRRCFRILPTTHGCLSPVAHISQTIFGHPKLICQCGRPIAPSLCARQLPRCN